MKIIKSLSINFKNKIKFLSFLLICGLLINTYSNLKGATLFRFFEDLTATISVSNSSVCKNETATITFEGAGGVAPYTFTYTENEIEKTIVTTGTNNSINIEFKSAIPGNYVFILKEVKDASETPVITVLDAKKTIKVNEPPVASFTVTNDGSCSGETLKFNNDSTGDDLTYSWVFGDDDTSTEKSPSHVFKALGCGEKNYNIKLIVTDKNGCIDSHSERITVLEKPVFEIYDPKERDFSNCGNVSSSNPEFEITVELESTTTASCITSYSINWDDGSAESDISFPIKHKYQKLGVYDMVITADGLNGCNVVIIKTVKNISNPSGSIVNPGSTQDICAPTNPVPFVISKWGDNSLDTRYEIDYGDGNKNILYQKDLINSDQYNSSDPDKSENYPVSHIYDKSSCPTTYTAYLNVVNACSNTETFLPGIRILEKPKLAFSLGSNLCFTNSILFVNNSDFGFGASCEESGRFYWDFGDGTPIINTRELTSQNHKYASPGTYTVKLSSTSFCVGENEIKKEICIEPEISPSFSVDTDAGCIPLNVSTTNATDESVLCSNPKYEWSVSYTSDNCGDTKDWVFTDDTDKNSINPKFQFTKPGKYTLTQKIVTECGEKTFSKIIDVKKPPTVSINPIEDSCGAITLNPVGNVQNCTSEMDGIRYNWTFTGGTPASSNSLDPGNIEFSSPGIHEVSLEVTSECGVSNKVTQRFEIFEKPVITNTDLSQEICSNQSTEAISFSSNNAATNYTWSAIASANITGFLSNGTNVIPAQKLINTSNSPGTVTYTVNPKFGVCNGDPVEFTVIVNPAPIITKEPTSSEICLNGTATLLEVAYENGTGIPSYQWFSNASDDVLNGTPIPDATTDSYNPPTNTVGELFYYVKISFASGGCSEITSKTAKVTVVPQVTVDPVAAAQTICVGGSADEMEVTYNGGTGNPTFKWYQNVTDSNVGGTIIPGKTTSKFTPDTFTTIGDFYYYAEISFEGNTGCSLATSAVYKIHVLADPIINTEPIASQELCQNATPTDVTVDVSGGTSSDFLYQWYQNSSNTNSGGTLILGANSASYTPNTSVVGTNYYYVIVSQSASGCAVTSAISSVKVNPAPIITKEPTSSEICLNGTATLLEVAYENGTGIPSYQWFSNASDDVLNGTPIPDATTDSYNPPTNTVGELFYYVKISFASGGCSDIVSKTASVIVNEIPVIQDKELTIYSETTFSFHPILEIGNTVPVGTTYTWSTPTFNPSGSILGASAATNPQEKISQTLENTGTTPVKVNYVVTPSTSKCIGNSFILVVTVNPSIKSNAVIAHNSCFKSNDGSIITSIIGGVPFETGNPYLISWIGPNGFTSSATTISNLEAGLYTLKIEDKTGYVITETFTITQPNLLTITKDVIKNISCFQGNDGVFEVTVSGGTLPYTYNWTTTDGDGIIINAENQNTLKAGTYTLEIIDKNNCSASTSVLLSEPEGLKIETVFQENILCFGDATGTIQINVSGGTPLESSPGVFDYLYSWSGPNGFTSTSKNINNLISGNYSVAVTDDLGCTTNADFVLNQSPEIQINYTKTDVSISKNNRNISTSC